METRFILLWLAGSVVLFLSLAAAITNKLRGKSMKVPLRNAAISFVASFAAFVGFGYILDNPEAQSAHEGDSPSRVVYQDERTTDANDPDSAISTAESYLSNVPMSQQEIYGQLLYEGYSEEESQAAVDAVDVDWNEQALWSAENRLEHSGVSESKLETDLGYAGFTPEQIQYAMDNITADWDEEALQAAMRYLEYSSLTGQDLYDQMVYEEFTEEQIEYAMENLPE